MIFPVHLDVALWRYVVIPAMAVVCAWGVLRRQGRQPATWRWFTTGWVAAAWGGVGWLAVWMTLRRTLSFHYGFFDLGVYSNKCWLVGTFSWTEKIRHLLTSGHTQPLMLVYAVLYRVWSHPAWLQVLQVVGLISAGWAAYRLARERFEDGVWAAWLTVGLLVFPAYQFGMLGTFRPDHLVVPLALLAMWCAHRTRWTGMAAALIAMGLVKEPYWLTVSAFGAMLAITGLSKRQGMAWAVAGLGLFVIIWICWPPHFPVYQGDRLVQGTALPHLAAPWHPKKLLWIWMLFMPFAGVPLVGWRWLVPALPTIGISLVSPNLLHVSTDSHYALGAVPFIWIAWMEVFRRWRDQAGEAAARFRLAGALVFAGVASAASSPFPYGLPFWHGRALGGMWASPQYRMTSHEERLRHLMDTWIPVDPEACVVVHNVVVGPRLVNRRECYPFSGPWRTADWIILDHTRGPGVEDGFDGEAYDKKIRQIEASGFFERIATEEGIDVWKKKT